MYPVVEPTARYDTFLRSCMSPKTDECSEIPYAAQEYCWVKTFSMICWRAIGKYRYVLNTFCVNRERITISR
jgi:hypothetical protein